MKKNLLIILSVVISFAAFAGGSVPVTFRVDMAGYTGAFTTPEVNGTFNGWCGNCDPMTNTSGTIWELTLMLDPGFYEYKFSHDEWAGQEILAPGSSCTLTTGEFTNRTLNVTQETILPIVCWASCAACGESTSRSVTFRVDMSGYTGTFTTPELNGSFNSWCGNCTPLTNSTGSIWQTTIVLEDGTYEYKFSHDNWSGQEQLSAGLPCTVTLAEFTNRIITVSQDTTLSIVCWNACVSCDLVSLESNELTSLTVYPNPSNGVMNIQGTTDAAFVEYTITDAQGRVIKSGSVAGSSMNEQVNLSNVGTGIYFVRLTSRNAQRVERILIIE
jgi:hypothetical protein